MNNILKSVLLTLVVASTLSVNVEAAKFSMPKILRTKKKHRSKVDGVAQRQEVQSPPVAEKPPSNYMPKPSKSWATRRREISLYSGLGVLSGVFLAVGFGDLAFYQAKKLVQKFKKAEPKEAIDAIAPAKKSVVAKRLTIARRVCGAALAAAVFPAYFVVERVVDNEMRKAYSYINVQK